MAASFHRPWYGLLGQYLTSLLQYALLAGLLVLWSRAGRRRPNGLVVGRIVVLACVAGQLLGILAGRPTDTAVILLALLARGWQCGWIGRCSAERPDTLVPHVQSPEAARVVTATSAVGETSLLAGTSGELKPVAYWAYDVLLFESRRSQLHDGRPFVLVPPPVGKQTGLCYLIPRF